MAKASKKAARGGRGVGRAGGVKAKAAGAKKPAKKSAGRKVPPGVPTSVKTGKGPGPREIGQSLVELFNRGQGDEVEKRWWSPKIESIEGIGLMWSGKKSVDAKNAEWMRANTILGGSAEGPFVGATGFSVKFTISVRENASGKETTMSEVGVYTVRDGKIVREEFMYGG